MTTTSVEGRADGWRGCRWVRRCGERPRRRRGRRWSRDHRLKFILIDNAGQAVAHYLLPMRSRDLQKGLDGSQLIVVNKGDALWRIAYRSFGEGVRYMDIVRKNTSDINNPDLIYPNQIFSLPKNGAVNTGAN